MLTAGLLFGCVSDAASDSTLPTITVGSDTYPPYVYMDNNGDITGLDVDIAEAVSYTHLDVYKRQV